MSELMRVKVRWSGFSGAPGFTVLHFRDFSPEDAGSGGMTQAMAQGATDKAFSAFQKIQTLLPSAVKIDLEPEVDILEDTTGELVSSFGITKPAQMSGTNSGTFAAASGAVLNWRTGGIRRGRRIRGRSFIVPISSAAFDGTGRLSASAVTQLQLMATTLADSTTTPDLGVYARPSGPGATDGQWSVVTSGSVTSNGAILTSRRD